MTTYTNTVARRYGKALFNVGISKGTLEEIDKDLTLVVHIFQDYPRIKRAYEDKKVYAEKKKVHFFNFFEDVIHETMLLFLFLLIENYREEYLFAISKEFTKLYQASQGIIQGDITTAVEISEENRQLIEASMSEAMGKKVILKSKINPGIIGGTILKFGNTLIDDSISSRIKKLEESFRTATSEIMEKGLDKEVT